MTEHFEGGVDDGEGGGGKGEGEAGRELVGTVVDGDYFEARYTPVHSVCVEERGFKKEKKRGQRVSAKEVKQINRRL